MTWMESTRFSRARLAAVSGLTEAEVAPARTRGWCAATAAATAASSSSSSTSSARSRPQHGGLAAGARRPPLRRPHPRVPRGVPAEQRRPRSTSASRTSSATTPGWARSQTLIRAAGLPPLDPAAPLRANDLTAFQAAASAPRARAPPRHRIHSTRATSEALRRAAEVQVQLFRDNVEPRISAESATRPSATRALAALAERTVPAIVEITSWLHARHLEHYVLQEVLADIEEVIGAGGARLRSAPVVVFVDLCGFTALTAGAGDRDAAAVAARFEDEVVDRSRGHGGRVVKLLGDGAMLHFETPTGALRASVEIVREVPSRGLPRCRVGAHRGPVVSHNGDLYGSTVNIAARINDYARPGEVLVSSEVLADDGHNDELDLEEIGEVSLKGVPLPVVLHRVRGRSARG